MDLQIDVTQSMRGDMDSEIEKHHNDLRTILGDGAFSLTFTSNDINNNIILFDNEDYDIDNDNINEYNNQEETKEYNIKIIKNKNKNIINNNNKKKKLPIKRLFLLGKGSTSLVYFSIRLDTLTPFVEKVIKLNTKNHLHFLKHEINSLKLLNCYQNLSSSFSSSSLSSSSIFSNNNNNIIKLYNIIHNLNENSISLCLELMNMGSLEDVIKAGGCQNENILKIILKQLFNGINFLHQKKIIHRDIKPSNILLSSNGIIKVSDFGLAKELNDLNNKSDNKTNTTTNNNNDYKKNYNNTTNHLLNMSISNNNNFSNTFVGTMEYMAPERLRGDQYGTEADIWACGLTIHSVALGKYPYKRNNYFDLLYHTNESSSSINFSSSTAATATTGSAASATSSISSKSRKFSPNSTINSNNSSSSSASSSSPTFTSLSSYYSPSILKDKNLLRLQSLGNFSNEFLSLIKITTHSNPKNRIDASKLLKDNYFNNVVNIIPIDLISHDEISPRILEANNKKLKLKEIEKEKKIKNIKKVSSNNSNNNNSLVNRIVNMTKSPHSIASYTLKNKKNSTIKSTSTTSSSTTTSSKLNKKQLNKEKILNLKLYSTISSIEVTEEEVELIIQSWRDFILLSQNIQQSNYDYNDDKDSSNSSFNSSSQHISSSSSQYFLTIDMIKKLASLLKCNESWLIEKFKKVVLELKEYSQFNLKSYNKSKQSYQAENKWPNTFVTMDSSSSSPSSNSNLPLPPKLSSSSSNSYDSNDSSLPLPPKLSSLPPPLLNQTSSNELPQVSPSISDVEPTFTIKKSSSSNPLSSSHTSNSSISPSIQPLYASGLRFSRKDLEIYKSQELLNIDTTIDSEYEEDFEEDNEYEEDYEEDEGKIEDKDYEKYQNKEEKNEKNNDEEKENYSDDYYSDDFN